MSVKTENGKIHAPGLLTGAERLKENLPSHLAIIMDGNGRWARERGYRRYKGHERGAESVRVIATESARLGLDRLTLYAFSVENWKRPRAEVTLLMELLRRFAIQERPTIMDNNIRLTSIGRKGDIPRHVMRTVEKLEKDSESNDGLNLCLALSYSGRVEVVDAMKKLAQDAIDGKIRPEDISEELVSENLYQPGPDPDLLVRTAGEMRVSNFLLWQISYAELYVTECCWPDFRERELHKAIRAFQGRRRTFGGLLDKPAELDVGA